MNSRRDFLRRMGLGAAVAPFLGNLPSLGAENSGRRKQRLIVMFSANGVIPEQFWPEPTDSLDSLPTILKPLEPFRDKLLTLHGVCDKVRGAGSAHMRGIGCLLTGVELAAGNLQGGSGPPAGWASGISIDQEIRNYLQADPATRTRFGSLEFGVMVPDKATVWTRMSYRGANQPNTPISDPYQMFSKLYGRRRDQEMVASVLDDVRGDLKRLAGGVSVEDRGLLEKHATFVREMEREFDEASTMAKDRPRPTLPPEVGDDEVPARSRMQIDLLANAFANDFARVATLQFSRATSPARLNWIGIDESHHTLSHKPDKNTEAQEKLVKINTWYCEQLAYLAQRLAETPEPGGPGSLLDNTLIVWTNELGKGNNHTQNDIPFVLLGGGLDFQMGRALDFDNAPHNRLHMALAQGFGHDVKTFGAPDFCDDGPLTGLS